MIQRHRSRGWPCAGGYVTGFADGSVEVLPKTITKEELQGMLTRNGGELVNWR